MSNYDPKMLKEDWQKVAKEFKIKYTDDNVVRYLVEKVAEKIGVDDKISNTNELKKLVCEKLNKLKTEESAKKDSKKSTSKTKTAKKTTKNKSTKKAETKPEPKKSEKLTGKALEEAKLEHMRKEAMRLNVNFGMEQTYNDIEQIVKLHCKNNDVTYMPYGADEPVNPKENIVSSTLEKLRAECKSLGLSYGEHHDENALQQLIDAVKAQGITANNSIATNPSPTPDASNPNKPKVAEEQPPMLGANMKSDNVIQDQGVPAKDKIVAPNYGGNPSSVDQKELNIYRDSIMNAINNHFRAMSLSEVKEIFMRANYPFTHNITHNPKNSFQISITLESKGNKVRLPNENKDSWITIGG